ncbi:hypothetical protein CWM47_34395 [Spirosoma pollinicola]|uniref:Uncharacterized protein n=1 Tax=Spirosoma pollinicola TaxID=2057025 RepID=A0A2K8Z9E8_9BACT|nr:hypothetical protein CWM47_34395 [Spirosoma pollinicola]
MDKVKKTKKYPTKTSGKTKNKKDRAFAKKMKKPATRFLVSKLTLSQAFVIRYSSYIALVNKLPEKAKQAQ